ncbi:uncharacterized protein LOC107042881 [Diachasma alloeum]|uniref:uncharacterized protein LOC107042881 n=1 Tax=Diachasma alloeum TaxID=454923 RepID=UPI0007381AD1|nr:uncharacterized protein LOC107042881 [Diachasma alloeum]
MHLHGLILVFCLLILSVFVGNSESTGIIEDNGENTLEKLVKLFARPGAFNRVDEILGENSIDEGITTACPKGEEGLDCRRAEARRSVDCPSGDCYCYSCAIAGPEMWASCCRESSKCCSHLAAACRNCDHPTLIPFCSKHFKKCLEHPSDVTTMRTTIERPLEA